MKKRLKLFRQKLELATIALTYAEAGEWKIAENYLEKINRLNKSRNSKIVVIALDSQLTQDTAEYTVNLAERMNYDLLAVNATDSRAKRAIPGIIGKPDLPGYSEKIFKALVDKARSKNIRFEAIITIDSFRKQIHKLIGQIQQVELVFIQTCRDRELSLKLDIPVYRIKAGRAC